MGFASGFNTGWSAVDETVKEYERKKIQEGLKKIGPEAVSTAGQQYQIVGPDDQIMGTGLVTPDMLGAAQGRGDVTGLEAIRQAYGTQYNKETGTYEPTGITVREMGPGYAARAGGRDIGLYSTEAESIQGAQPYNLGLMRQAANVYEQGGRGDVAMQLRAQARQSEMDATRLGMEQKRLDFAEQEAIRNEELFPLQKELLGVQKGAAQTQAEIAARALAKEKNLDTDLIEANKELDPTKRTTLIMDALTKADPVRGIQYSALVGQDQLNKINLDALKHEKGFQENFSKGEDAIIDWLDKQNPGFILKRQGNTVYKFSNDGKQNLGVFTQGTLEQRMQQIAGMATPTNFLKLAEIQSIDKYRQTMMGIKQNTAKIDPVLKTRLDYAEAESINAQRALAQDPTNPALRIAANSAKFKLFEMYQAAGAKDDPFAASGIPTPAERAKQILKLNLKKTEEVQAFISDYGSLTSPKYAQELKDEYTRQRADYVSGKGKSLGKTSTTKTEVVPVTPKASEPSKPPALSKDQRAKLSAQRKKEEAEMNLGSRMQYSPEVKQLIQTENIETGQKSISKERELERKKMRSLGLQ